jgi:hypothetical protein
MTFFEQTMSFQQVIDAVYERMSKDRTLSWCYFLKTEHASIQELSARVFQVNLDPRFAVRYPEDGQQL